MTPCLFLRAGFSFDLIDPLPRMSQSWTYLRVRYPASIPTHCESQVFCFDEGHHPQRLDYTARVVGSDAAHICESYRDFDGLEAPTSRRVGPILVGHRPLPAPTLVALEIHDICPVRAA